MTRTPTPTPGWRQGWPCLAAATAARFVLACAALLLAVSVLPAVAGWQSTVVLSASMEPTLAPGDLVVVRPVAAAELTPGRIVLVDDPDVAGALRVHRIAAVQQGELRLRGDANPQADGTPVPVTAVHGVGTLRLPRLGLPVLWLREGRTGAVALTVAAVLGLVVVALLHRGPAEDRPQDRPARRRRRQSAPRAVALGVVAVVVAAVPGADGARAVFSAAATNAGNTLAASTWWSCGAAVASAAATQYYPLQEAAGPLAANAGSLGTGAPGTYSSGGVTYGARGPRCASGQQSAVTLDGSTGALWTSNAVTNPQTFTEQIWFSTTTTTGGKLIGFGSGANGTQSSDYDRQIVMTNSGQLSFGVYDGATHVVTSAASYNDGNWHLATATFTGTAGASTLGMTLYVDGVQVGRDSTATVAQTFTGYWRIGYDNISNWPGQPTSFWFAGSLAHAAVFPSSLTAAQVAQQYGGRPWGCADAAGTSGSTAALYLPLQEGAGPTAVNKGSAGPAANGTYAGTGVSYNRVGPNCGTNVSDAVRFDGSTGHVWTSQAVANPQSFTEQIWFATTATTGGKLIGFGDGTGGALSPDYDRHIYMNGAGVLTFGVWNNAAYVVSTTGAYNDGNWHLATGTFSPATGMAFYVDGTLIGRNTQVTAAWNGTGYWRIGADSVGGWPNAPATAFFTGRLAHASVYYRVLAADEVAGQYLAGK